MKALFVRFAKILLKLALDTSFEEFLATTKSDAQKNAPRSDWCDVAWDEFLDRARQWRCEHGHGTGVSSDVAAEKLARNI